MIGGSISITALCNRAVTMDFGVTIRLYNQDEAIPVKVAQIKGKPSDKIR